MPTIKGPIAIKKGEEIPDKIKNLVIDSFPIKKVGGKKSANKTKKN